MKNLTALLATLMLTGCGIMPTSKINEIQEANRTGQSTSEFLQEMRKQGLFCQHLKRFESDPRLKSLTDGTLVDVQFHQCMAESDGGFCIARASTYVLSQYGKVIRVKGLDTERVCFWD